MSGRVGVVTIFDYANYGNRLQNYAVHAVLKSLGFEPETIVSRKFAGLDIWRRVQYVLEKALIASKESRVFAGIMSKLSIARLNSAQLMLGREKCAAGERFVQRNIKVSSSFLTPRGLSGGSQEDFKFFVVGSDQVWNPFYRNGSSIEFLCFAPPEKRFSYSASFAVSEIPGIFAARYSRGLAGMRSISVREDEGREIVRKLCDRDVVVTVDPTLMISEHHWRSLATPHRLKPAGRYVLQYFLSSPASDAKEAIKEFCNEEGLDLASLADFSQPHLYAASPEEFLDFIGGADAVFTDSFHGAIFSIIFGRPFMVFNRCSTGSTDMGSRMRCLLARFELQDRCYIDGKIDLRKLETDYGRRDEIISAARLSSICYLQSALRAL